MFYPHISKKFATELLLEKPQNKREIFRKFFILFDFGVFLVSLARVCMRETSCVASLAIKIKESLIHITTTNFLVFLEEHLYERNYTNFLIFTQQESRINENCKTGVKIKKFYSK